MIYLILALIVIEVVIISLFYLSYNKEKAYVYKLIKHNYDEKIKAFLQRDLVYFLTKTYIYKVLFYTLNIAIIYMNSIIPILNHAIQEENRIYISIIAAVASICSSIITFSACHKNWTRHGNTFMTLKYEVENYIYNPEKDDNSAESFKKFYSIYTKTKLKNLDGWLNENKEWKNKVKENQNAASIH